ncbi:hypothetical protein N7454_000149 [Penicillium verhagenii]|nr:hypothetical protein N7454_000149 [Penicillium verhagenii]
MISSASWNRLRSPAQWLLYTRQINTIRPTLLSTASAKGSFRSHSSAQSSNETPITFQPASRLSGRTCMVTGGTSGIGFAIAERFLQEGASSIILVGRSRERLEAAAMNLQSPAKVQLLVGDVAEAGTWMRELEKEMTNVDVLVNAAGISITNILPRSEVDDISKILRTNLEGAILTSRALMRAAIRSRVRNRNAVEGEKKPPSRCIINISSLLALKAGTGAVPYAASKAGLLGLTRSVAVEAAASLKGVVIRSNVILPGYIETPMISDFTTGEVGRLNDSIPLHRFGQPSEVADAAVFLAHNEYANNCVLNLDGGLSAV